MKTETQVPKLNNQRKSLKVVKATAEPKKADKPTPKKEEVKKEIVKEEKNVIVSAEKTEQKETLKDIIQNFAPPTAEQRIKNADNFKILTDKFGHLQTKSDELKRFKISSDGTKEKIYLENAEGFKFEVSNSKIIDATLELLENTLNGILRDTEQQVQNFVI